MVKIKNLPPKFEELWKQCLPLLEQGGAGDLEHTKAMAEDIASFQEIVTFDLDVLLSAALLHDITHIRVVENYFQKVVITERLKNGKLIEISPAGKIMKTLLERIETEPEKIEEILGIIKAHSLRHLKDGEPEKLYDTNHKKLFHDFDLLTRFKRKELKTIRKTSLDREQFKQIVASQLKSFFFDELREVAKRRFRKIEGLTANLSWSSN